MAPDTNNPQKGEYSSLSSSYSDPAPNPVDNGLGNSLSTKHTLQAEDHLTIAFLIKYPIESARILETFSPQATAALLSPLTPLQIAHVLQYMLPHSTLAFLYLLPEEIITDILSHMTQTSAVITLHYARRTWRAGILGKMNSRENAAVLKAFSYAEETAGRLANPHIPILTADRSVSDAIQWIQNHQEQGENHLYIVDRQHRLIGHVSLKDLLITDLDKPLESITTTSLITLPSHWIVEQILNSPSWLTYHTLPVIDSHHTFLGTISYQSLLSVLKVKHSTESQTSQLPGGSHADSCSTNHNTQSSVTDSLLSEPFEHATDHSRPKQSA